MLSVLHGPSLSSLPLASAARPPSPKLPTTAQPVFVVDEEDYSNLVLKWVVYTLGWLLLLYFAIACYQAKSQARTVNAEPAHLLHAGAYEPAQAVPNGPLRSRVRSAGTNGPKQPTR